MYVKRILKWPLNTKAFKQQIILPGYEKTNKMPKQSENVKTNIVIL